MIDEPPVPPAAAAPAPAAAETSSAYGEEGDGKVVIDLTRLVPPPPEEDCADETPDPLQPAEITVCRKAPRSPRLGPQVGPVDDFGSAIPRARVKLSERAEAEANLAKTPVGGFDADGAEVRVKIDF